jgi:hypothetical protein
VYTPVEVKPVIPEVLELGVVIPGVDGPLTKLHAPVPTEGAVAFMVAVPGEAHTVWFVPAFAVDGFALTVRTMLLVELVQGELAMVQRRVYVPAVNGVNTALSAFTSSNCETLFVAPPDTLNIDQEPIPTVATFAARLAALPMQIVCGGPALAVVGVGFTVIVISLVDATHGLLLTVQRKVYTPAEVKPVMPEVLELGVVIPGVDGPLTKLHAPVPTEGAVAFMVAVPSEAHTVWFVPAFAAEGFALTVNVMLLVELVQGEFATVQRKE